MICVSSLEGCDSPMIPDRHQCLLRINMMNLLGISGFGQLQDKNYRSSYCADVDGYLVYIEAKDDGLPLVDLGLDAYLIDLQFDGVVFCEYSQCFDAVLVTNNSFAYQFIIPAANITAATRQCLLDQAATSEDTGLIASKEPVNPDNSIAHTLASDALPIDIKGASS